MMLVLKANPDPYGRFGHQTCNQLASFLLANITGSYFSPERYQFISHKFNSIINWESLRNAHTHPISKRYYIEDFLPDHTQKETISSIVVLKTYVDALNLIAAESPGEGYALVELPFGLLTGVLDNLIPMYQAQLKKIYIAQNQYPASRVSIHLRRGDASKANRLLVNEEFQREKILYILEKYIPSHLPIHILTQETNPEKLRFLTDYTNERQIYLHLERGDFMTNTSDVDHFNFMANSSHLILGKSAFSKTAALLGKCNKVFDLEDEDTNTRNLSRLGIIRV